MVFLLAASVHSMSWLCDSKRSYFESTRPTVALAVVILSSTIMSGCLGSDDWDESELDFRDFYEHEYHICYDSKWRWFDCHGFPDYLGGVDRADRDHSGYRWSSYSVENGDLLKLTLSSHEDSSGMAVVNVTTQDTSDSFKLRTGDSESRIFEMSGHDRYLDVELQADNGWFGDIVHYTIEVQIDITHRDTDLDGYIDAIDSCETYGTSSMSQLGCLDSDDDGWSNIDEYACGTSGYLWNHTPQDYDNDSICNYLDEDDDGDGWNDSVELSCGADWLSPDSIPVVNETGDCYAIQIFGEGSNGGFWRSFGGLFMIVSVIGFLLIFSITRSDTDLYSPHQRNPAVKRVLSKAQRSAAAKKGWRTRRANALKQFELEPLANEIGHIRVSRNDINHSVWVESQNGQTIGDAVASSGIIGRDGTPWSINDSTGMSVEKSAQASRFWTQSVSVIFQ